MGGIGKKAPALAIADPHTHSAKAIPVVGFAIESLMWGAKAIAAQAATGMMLNMNNSDHAVGKKI